MGRQLFVLFIHRGRTVDTIRFYVWSVLLIVSLSTKQRIKP